jgi:hypothetical protein
MNNNSHVFYLLSCQSLMWEWGQPVKNSNATFLHCGHLSVDHFSWTLSLLSCLMENIYGVLYHCECFYGLSWTNIDEHTTCIDDFENYICPMFPVHLWFGVVISKREIVCKSPHLKSNADILSISMWRTLTFRSLQSTLRLSVRVMKSINLMGMIEHVYMCFK